MVPQGRYASRSSGGTVTWQVRCQACHEATFIDLADVCRPAATPVWKLEGALACRPCRERGDRAPRGTIERLGIAPAPESSPERRTAVDLEKFVCPSVK